MPTFKFVRKILRQKTSRLPTKDVRNSKPRLVLHIGTEKTGSTSLQATLHSSNASLQENGVYYFSWPNRADARTLAAAALGDKDDDELLRLEGVSSPESKQHFLKRVRTHIAQALADVPEHIHTVIISSEHFHSRLTDVSYIQSLKDLLTPWTGDIFVLVYLRRQLDLALSLRTNSLTNGRETRALRLALEQTCHPDNVYFNYQRLLDRWSEVFGKDHVLPRLFDQELLLNGDVTADFLHAIDAGIDPADLDRTHRRINTSVSRFGQELLRLRNLIAGSQKDTPEFEQFTLMVRKHFSGPGEYPDLEQATSIQQAFNASNREVLRQWFPDRSRLFRPVRTEDFSQPRDETLSVEAQRVLFAFLSLYHTDSGHAE